MGAQRRGTLSRGSKPGSQGMLLKVLPEVDLKNSYKLSRVGEVRGGSGRRESDGEHMVISGTGIVVCGLQASQFTYVFSF